MEEEVEASARILKEEPVVQPAPTARSEAIAVAASSKVAKPAKTKTFAAFPAKCIMGVYFLSSRFFCNFSENAGKELLFLAS